MSSKSNATATPGIFAFVRYAHFAKGADSGYGEFLGDSRAPNLPRNPESPRYAGRNGRAVAALRLRAGR
jgi:hypothetical protein